ncbi:MAG: rRNA maturation RNase YbeY [Bacteroidota bacterium]
MSIRIFYDETKFRLKGWKETVKIIERVISEELNIAGELNFILTTDEILRNINVQFLKHDYNTDVITFNYNVGNVINGEIYISMETVKKNALNYNVSLNSEVFRVIIHGVLHLVGYDDKTEKQKGKMRRMEDLWLGKIEE